jgi:hypothetical protein
MARWIFGLFIAVDSVRGAAFYGVFFWRWVLREVF